MERDVIKCVDCLVGMKEIPDGAVDMILVDPPFQSTNNFWDKRLPMSEMWTEFKRVTKENAAILIFSQLPFAVDVINANRKMFRYEWIWHKTTPVGFLNANKMPLRAHENILVFYRKLPTYNPQYWYSTPYSFRGHVCNDRVYRKLPRTASTSADGRRYPLTVMNERNCCGFNQEDHGTQKPVALLEYLIKTYTNEGELVLDACMGSGSTAVAAVKTNRHFIGYETHQPFVDICNRRIAEAREELLRVQTSVLEGLEDGDKYKRGDNVGNDDAVQ